MVNNFQTQGRAIRMMKTALVSLTLALLTAQGSAQAGGEPTIESPLPLKPYRATYQLNRDGLNAQVERELKRLNERDWQLSDSGRVLFFSLDEKVTMRREGNRIQPLHYRYRQSPGSSKHQDIFYDWDTLEARFELSDDERQAKLTVPSYDKLSFQLQLRLDLMAGKLDEPKTYRLVDRGRYKVYRVERLGEEQLRVGDRTFDTVKLSRTRPGEDDRQTLLWAAPALDYLMVRIVHEEADERFEMTLKSSTLL